MWRSLASRLPRRVFYTSRNDKVLRQELRASYGHAMASYWQELCGKCVRDGSPLGFGLAEFFRFFWGGSEAERTSGGAFFFGVSLRQEARASSFAMTKLALR